MPQRKKRPGAQPAKATSPLIEELRRSWPELDAAVVAERLGGGAAAAAFIEALAGREAAAVRVLEAIAARFDDKQVRKALRKARFRLARQGVEAPSLGRDATAEPPVLHRVAAAWSGGAVGPYLDLAGARGVLLWTDRGRGAHTVGTGLISESEGIVRFETLTGTRREARENRERIRARSGKMTATSLAHVLTLLERAYRRQAAGGPDAPADYRDLRPWLLGQVDLLAAGPIYERFPEGADPDALTREDLEALCAHADMQGWLLDADSLRSLLDDMAEARKSPLVLSQAQQRERLLASRARALDRIFPPEARASLGFRLEEMAYLFLRQGEEPLAVICLQAAGGLALPSHAAGKAFMDCLLDRSLRLVQEMLSERAGRETEASLILRP